MSEKKGFFRRVFSFGQPDAQPADAVRDERVAETNDVSATTVETPAEPTAKAELRQADAPAPSVEAAAQTPVDPLITLDGGLPAQDIADAERADAGRADAASAEPDSPADETPAADTAATVVATSEPVWLAPDAPEPVADFSWLDADDGRAEAETPVAELVTPEDEVHPAGDGAMDIAPDPLAKPADLPTTATSSGDDFSFLDADAPLPEEDEPADFSWLDPDAPIAPVDDGSEASSTAAIGAAIGAAGVAAAANAASTGEGGWRVREAAAPVAPAVPAVRVTWIERLREGLARSSSQLSGSITTLFTKRRLDEETLQDFEDVLIQADLGVETALRITSRLSDGRFGKEITGAEVRQVLADEVEATLRPVALPLELDLEKKPHVILVVGVNGTGKTTTIGKLAAKLTRGGLKVTLCAGDTFRAAAVEQLKIWGERTGSEVVAKAIGADAAGLAFEAYDKAVENGSDVLIIDTAGRLQNKTELMAELEKIVRVLQRREPDAPHTVLQTLDATTGQNALSQVEIFRNVAGVNGLVMTKLDGTARGGILVAIAAKYRLPVYFIGVGEGIDDLEPFKAKDFAMAIAGKA